MIWAQYIIVGSISFLLGFFTSYFILRIKGELLDIKSLVALTVLIVFLTGMFVEFVNPSYKLPLGVMGLMGAVVGAYYKDLIKK